MLRNACAFLHQCFCGFTFEKLTCNGYMISHKLYLIQIPPKRPITPFSKFIQHTYSNLNQVDRQEMKEIAGKQWKKLPPQSKERYENNYKFEKDQYLTKMADYEAKYTNHFKRVTFSSIHLKKAFSDQSIKAKASSSKQEYIATLKEVYNISEEEKKEVQNQVKLRKAANDQALAKYMFPQKYYYSQKSWNIRHKTPKVDMKEKLEADYTQYCKQYELKLTNWLKEGNINLTYQQFRELFNQTMKAQNLKKFL